MRIPQVAAAVGVSPRTFNNYFAHPTAPLVDAVRTAVHMAVHGMTNR